MRKLRITLALDEETAALLDELAASPRKKSELVTRLLRQAAADAALADVEDPIARIEQRVERVERRLEQLLARPG